METILTLNGNFIKAKLVQEYDRARLFFSQDRLVITDLMNREVTNLDVIDFVSQYK
jgi:hypothetical protein